MTLVRYFAFASLLLIVFVGLSNASSPAPSFSIEQLDGEKTSLGSLKGKGVVINFWATWCGPCKAEMPMFNKVYNSYKDKEVVFLGVNYKEPSIVIEAFLEEATIAFPILLDLDGKMSKTYNVTALPTTHFINKNGDLIGSHAGVISEELLEEWIGKLLEDSSKGI